MIKMINIKEMIEEERILIIKKKQIKEYNLINIYHRNKLKQGKEIKIFLKVFIQQMNIQKRKLQLNVLYSKEKFILIVYI